MRQCDNTLSKCAQTNKDKEKVIEAQKIVIEQTQERVEELEKKESSIFNSKTFWFILGIATAATTVFLVKPSQ